MSDDAVDDLSIETIAHSGALRISAMRSGFRRSKLYFGYEREEAIEMFNEEFPPTYEESNENLYNCNPTCQDRATTGQSLL